MIRLQQLRPWALGLLLCLEPLTSQASDHADPLMLTQLEAGITDLFAFPNGDNLVVILCVRRALTPDNELRLAPYTYHVHIDHHSKVDIKDTDALARHGGRVISPREIEADIQLEFQLTSQPIRNAQLGASTNQRNRLRKTMIRQWDSTGLANPEQMRLWAGVCDDPFIFFRFATTNCIAIVCEIPFTQLPQHQESYLLWATSEKFGKQIDHVGRSLRTMAPRLESLNTLHPSQHVDHLYHRHHNPGVVDDVASFLIPPLFGLRHYDFAPDVMIYRKQLDNTGKVIPAAYPNGRKLEDDVALLCCQQGDCLLYEVSLSESNAAHQPRPTDNSPREEFLSEFPYLLTPNTSPTPLPDPTLRLRTISILVVGALVLLAIVLLPWVLWWRLRSQLIKAERRLAR